jgi:hypothetical protein
MEKVSTARIALKWGLIYGIVSIIVNTVLLNTELWKNFIIGILIMFINIFLVLYLAMKDFKELNNGLLSFKEGLGLGTLTMFTGGLLSVAYDNFYRKFIDPTLLEQTIEMVTEKYESMGLPEDKIEEAVTKMQESANSGLNFLWGVLGLVFVGFICSLIMAAILKKEKPVFS